MKNIVLKIIYSILVRNFLRFFIGVKFEKAHFLIHEKQFIIIANHNSHLDTMAVMASIPSKLIQKVKPVAAKDYFGKTKLQEKLSNYFINTLLIKRDSSNNQDGGNPIRQMIAELDKGYSLIIFPEGSRGEPEKMQSLKKGIALVLLERPSVKYVPVFLYGMGKALPKGDNIILPFESSLIYGQAHRVNTSLNKNELINEIEQNLLELKEKTIQSS